MLSLFPLLAFQDVPASMTEATIVVPGVKERVVASLLDFLYTGEMSVSSEDTADLQLLIDTLQIDPSLIQVTEDGDDDDEDDSTERNPETSAASVAKEAEKTEEAQKDSEVRVEKPPAGEKSAPPKRKAEPEGHSEDETDSEQVVTKRAKESRDEHGEDTS